MAQQLTQFVESLAGRQFPVEWPGNWIGKRWQLPKAGEARKSLNPNTGELLCQVLSDRASIGQAIDFAEQSRAAISQVGLEARLNILRLLKQHLADHEASVKRCLQIEAGKPQWEATSDFDAALRYLSWVAENGGGIFESLLAPARLGKVSGDFRLLPLGVVAAYLPFSTPLTSFVHYFSASVLAGCPLILSTSSHAALSSILFAHLDQELDLPAGMLQVLFGNFDTFKKILSDRRIAAVLFLGSREHCDEIRNETRTRLGRQHVLQSGGKNAVLVHSTADLDQAVKATVYGATKSSGQLCSSTSRVFIYRPQVQEFSDRLVRAMKALDIGRTDLDNSPGPFMGPLYSQKAVEKFLRFQTMAARESKQNYIWGKAIEGGGNGYFVRPGIHYLDSFDPQSAYQGNVLFSPDLALYGYDRLEQAIEMCNSTDAALAVSFIGDPDVVKKRREQFLAPNILVNRPTVEFEATLPLAGRLQSGHHRYHSAGIALYLCYPQVVQLPDDNEEMLSKWPWPAI
jgi:acyl-CoA reductase-like NAD-dependent aldehyde dehydrogenase